MKLKQEFAVDHPRDKVWAFFHDVAAVADCLPGATYLGEKDDGAHSGTMSMKVGPFQASFEGAAKVVYDEAGHSVSMEGKGVDKKGASRGKMKMDCQLVEVDGVTRVTVDADVQLSGSIAQFGRTGIIEEIASVLIADFVSNVETRLAPAPAAPAEAGTVSEAAATAASARPTAAPAAKAPLSGGRLLWLAIRGWFRSLFRRKGKAD